MARAPSKPAAQAEAPKTTALANWDEELARLAEISAGMEAASGGGQFFSMKSGVLSFDGNVFPGNQMACVIVDSIYENVYYEGRFDPDNPAPPVCFAFARGTAEGMPDSMAPHSEVFKKNQEQSDFCVSCKKFEWGSADTGKGKACRTTRRLAVIPAGNLDAQGRFTAYETPEKFQTALAYIKLPVTSITGYGSFVKQVAGVLKRPPFGIFTRVFLTPDTKTQFKCNFESLGPVPNDLMPAIMARHEEAKSLIEFPYNLDVREAATAKPAGRAAAPAKGRGAKRY